MIGLRYVGFALAAVLALGVSVPDAGAQGRPDRPVVVELFTSQSCYSCPPAEKFLGKFAQEPDVIALEFHVDYWNDLNYGSAGRWKDVFSRPEFTRRQQDYNRHIRKRPAVYTPQMVIDGRFEKVGSTEWAVEASIRRARGLDEPGVRVAVRNGDANGLSVVVDGAAKKAAAIWLVRFKRVVTTDVQRGEKHGKRLDNYHIVTGLTRIGDWRGRAVTLDVPNVRPDSEEGCVVLVQGDKPDAIIGAANCPSPGA